jgi:hypothetical protein
MSIHNRLKNISFLITAVSALCPLPMLAEDADVTQHQAETGKLQPDSKYELRSPAVRLSAGEMEALLQRKYNLRAQRVMRVKSAPSPQGLPPVAGPETRVSLSHPRAAQLQGVFISYWPQ